MIPSLIQGVGSQYEQAINGGATKEQAIKSSIIGGIPSGLVEVLGGPENLTSKLASKMPFGRTVLESGLEEMFEEIIQYPIENLGQKIAYDKDMPLYSTTESALINPKEQLYSGASAFVSSALMGGAGVGVNNLMNKLDTRQRNVVVNLEEGLNEIYTAIDNGVPATEQDLDNAISFLKVEKQNPDLKEYLQGHISKVDIYKQQIAETFTQPRTNENIEVEQTLGNDTNFAQNSFKDLTDDITVSNTPTIDNQDNVLQNINNNITEMQQEGIQTVSNVDNVTNVTEDIGYHAGDLGKADYLNIMPGRGTGHFGTGTYFVGNEKDIDIGDYKNRPRHTVSFEGYNLYKPKTSEEGRKLHKFLKDINDMSLRSGYEDVIDDIINSKVDDEYIDNLIETKFPYNSDFELNIDYSKEIEDIGNFDDIEEMLKQIDKKISQTEIPPEVIERKRNIEQYRYFLDKTIDNIENVKQELKDKFNFSDEKINKTIKELYQYGTSNLKSNKMDSPSTIFMKSLGYEGVDVRGLKGLDDTEFGSVIYDLKDNAQAIAQPTANETIQDEQTLEENANVAQNEDKDTEIEQQEVVAENETTETEEKVLGKTGTAKDNEGNAIEFVYEVVNAKDLITSHNTELGINENYPQELQPRDRSRAAGQLQVNDIVNNLQPEFLGENAKISDGAPIVGNDNVVESGNGRTIALTKMYQMKHDNQSKYIEWLKDKAENFGIDIENLPENPVLVRRRTTEVDRASFVKKANESSVASMSATETAKSDAEKLSNDILNLFYANEDGNINTRENKSFIEKFIGEVIPKNEQNKYITDKGNLSQEGLTRVRNAIFYKAYEDIYLMNKLAESLDNNTKNITNALLSIAPKVVDIKTSIEQGNLYDIEYSKDITEAANIYMELKESNENIDLYLQQESLFDDENTSLIKDVVAIFNTNNRSAKKLALVFNKLLDSVESLGNPNQINMFGETETYNKTDVLEATLRRLEDEDNAQVTLFQTRREESTGDTKDNQGKQTTERSQVAEREALTNKEEVLSQFQGETPQSEKDKILGIVPPGFNIMPTPITEKFSYDSLELKSNTKKTELQKKVRLVK